MWFVVGFPPVWICDGQERRLEESESGGRRTPTTYQVQQRRRQNSLFIMSTSTIHKREKQSLPEYEPNSDLSELEEEDLSGMCAAGGDGSWEEDEEDTVNEDSSKSHWQTLSAILWLLIS